MKHKTPTKPLFIFLRVIYIYFAILFSVSLIYITLSCSLSTPDDPPVIVHDDPPPDEPPIIDDDPEEPVINPIVFGLYDGTLLSFYDGSTITDVYTGSIVQAGPRILAIDDVLYHFDEYGNVLESEWLPVYPEAVAISGTDIYTFERIDPDTAYNLGAMPREYTRVFENNTEIGTWYLNEWRVSEILILDNGDMVALGTTGGYHTIIGSNDYWKAYDKGIGIYQLNPGNRIAYISDSSGDYLVNWGANYFNSARWQLSNDTWYSNNGYEWTPSGLLENTNSLQDFQSTPYPVALPNGEPPKVIPAASRIENSESVSYWIECNSGYMFRHIPSLDKLEAIVRLYTGDGYRLTGVYMASYIDPILIDDILYFHDSGSIMKYDFQTGLVSIFSQEMEIMRW